MPTVLDASAVVELLIRNPAAEPVAAAIGRGDAVAPALLDVEVVHVLARLERLGELSAAGGSAAVDALVSAPITRVSRSALARAAWRRRHNLSAYDAVYAALAAALRAPLITADRRLANALLDELAVTVLPPSR